MAEPLHIAVHEWQEAESLPPGWRVGFENWAFVKQLCLRNELAAPRADEPIELEVEFHTDHVTDPVREVRVLAVPADAEPGKSLTEIPSQIHHVDSDDNRHRCRLYFLADLSPSSTHTWLVLYGNQMATVPQYETDLKVTGQEYALIVENAFYRIELAPTTGHLKSVTFRQGTASFCGYGPPMDPGVIGDGKHGVEGSVHWNPDWSDGHTGRYRVTNWPRPPHYTVIRGPVYTRVERWGHPILGLGPCGNYKKVRARVAYTFWALQPYVIMESSLEILQDVRFRDCRNDEWVGMGASMPKQAWMMANGELGFGRHNWQHEDPAWMSFYNEDNGDAFATLRLDYECTHPHFPAPASVAILDRAWVRYPVRNVIMRAGDVIREKSAILVHRYTPGPHDGFAMLMDCHARLRSPLSQEDVPVIRKHLTKPNVADALRACRDLEIYVEGNYNSRRTPGFYDLGLVRDIDIVGDDVHLTMVMPCEGRQTWFEWFAEVAEQEIRRRLEPVGDVAVKLTDTPTWSPRLMSIGARRIMGFEVMGFEVMGLEVLGTGANSPEERLMLNLVHELTYTIVLCDDIEGMKKFYRDLLPFAVDSESDTSLALRAGGVLLGLRQRTRDYDGVGARQESPGLQLAFRVEPAEVAVCHQMLVDMGVTILDPPTDQPRGHRTVYFADPEGNVLEVYAEI